MKSIACLMCALAVLLAAPAAFAKTENIARDPYVGAIVIDADTGETLFSDQADQWAYPASVLKLMDLYIILEKIQEGKLTLADQVHVTAEASRMGGSQVYLKEHELFTIEELLYALMIQSANDAATALAIHIAGSKDGFVSLMNEKARELGMTSTRFVSVHGLPPSADQDPDRTTARDIALLSRALLKFPEVFSYTSTRERTFRPDAKEPFIMRTHNNLLGKFEGCDGFKTGYFRAAGFSISATAKRGGNRIIAVILGSTTKQVRDAKAAELLSKGFLIAPPRAAAAPAPVVAPSPAPAVAAAAQAMPEEADDEAGAETESASQHSGGTWIYIVLGVVIGAIFTGGIFLVMSRRHNRAADAAGKTHFLRR